MAGAPWTRAPTGFLSCLYSCLLCTVLLGNVETTVSTSTISGQTTTDSQTTSTPRKTPITSTSTFSNTTLTTATSTSNSKHSTVTTEDTSSSKTGSPPPVTSVVSSTAISSTTCTQEISAVSQNPQTQGGEKTRGSPTSTHVEVTTSSPPTSQGGNTLTQTVSRATSHPGETATTSVSIVSKTPPRTAGVVTMPTSAHSTLATTENTSSPNIGSPPPVTSGVSTTTTSSTTSTQETSAVSQNPQTQGRETTRESPTSTHPVVTSSATQSSPGGHTLTQTVSQVTSTAGETATTSPSKFSQMPSTTSEVLTTPTSTYSTVETTEETSSPKTGSPPPVTSGVSTTATSSTTSTQETSAVSQNPQTQGGETTRESPTSTHVQVTTSAPPSSPGGHTLTQTASQKTTPPCETVTSHSSFSQTPSTTSEVLTKPTSIYSTVERTEETSTLKTGSPPPVTSVVSSTATSSTTSTQETSAVSQNPQTLSLETTRGSPTSTHVEVTTSSPPTSQGGNTLTQTVSRATSHPGETATTSVSIVSKTPPRTAGVVTMPTSAHSTLATAEDTSSPRTGSPPPVTSGVSTTATSSTTSTQETSAVSQNPQTQGRETTRESPTSTHPVVTSSATQSSPGRHTLTQTVSQVTSTPGETATTSPSKFSQMPSTSEVLTTPTSTYSTVETTEETSSPKTGSPPPVTSGVSTTATSSTTSTQETSAVSQNPQTQGGETTRGSPTSTHVEVTTSTPPSSPGGNTLTETVSQVTSPPGETATSPSSVSQTSTTSEVLKTPTSSYSTVETTEETSTPKTGSPPPVTSVVSTTTTSSTTSTQETLTVSQNPQTEGRETTRESPTSTHPDVTTSSPPSAPGRNTLTETVSKQTSPPSETATTSVSIVSKTPPRTAGVVTTSTSAHSTLATAEDTSSSNTGSPPLVTSAVSTTAATKEKSASTSLTTSTLDAIGTLPSATSPPGESTISHPSKVTNILHRTLGMVPRPTSTHHTPWNTADMPLSVTTKFMPVPSAFSTPATAERESTTTSSSTFMQGTLAFSWNPQTQSMGTSTASHTSAPTEETASTPTSSLSGHTLTETISQETIPPTKMATVPPSSTHNTDPTTMEVSKMPTSPDSTVENRGHTSLPTTGNMPVLTSKVSTTPLSTSSLTSKTLTVFPTYQRKGTETPRWSHDSSLISTSMSQETFITEKMTMVTSSFSVDNNTTQLPKELLSMPTGVTCYLVTKSPTPSTTGTTVWVTPEVPTTGELGESTTQPDMSPSTQKTMIAVSQTQWTQGPRTTGEIHINSPSSGSTMVMETVASPSPSSTISRHTSQETITAWPKAQSTPHSPSSSPRESLSMPSIGHTHATLTTPESQAMSSITPETDTPNVATSAASSATPSGPSSSESTPQEASTVAAVTTSIPAPSRDSHPATGPRPAPPSPSPTLRLSGAPSLSTASTVSQDAAVTSPSGGPGGQQALPFASTSPDTAQVISQTQQTRGTETTGEAQPSTPAPSVPDPTAAAMAATSSPTARGTTFGRAFPETATAAKTTDFPTTPSSSSHAAPPTAELLSSGTSPDATPAAVGMRSPAVPSTSPPTITGVPTDWTASSRTPQEKPAVSQMAHTPSAGATRGPEVSTLAWQLTDTFSAVTAPPPSPTTMPTEHTSQTETRTPSPSGSSTASIPTPGSHSHGSQTTMPALSSGTAGGPSAVGPTTLGDAAPSSPSVVDSSEEVLTGPKSVVPENTTAVVTSPARPSASSTESTRAPPSSMGISSTHPRGPPAAVQTSATTSRTRSTSVSSTKSPGSVGSSTLAAADKSTHPLPSIAVATPSETSTSSPGVTNAYVHVPTSAVSPSIDADPATDLWASPTSPVTSQENPGDLSATVTRSTTFDTSATAGPARQSTPLPPSSSPRESLSMPSIGHTHATLTTPESQAMSSITPETDTPNVATSAASSATPSGPSSSESTPQEASTVAAVTTSIPAPSRDSHPATGPRPAPPSPSPTLRPSGAPSLSTASTVSQDAAVTSPSGGPGGQQALPFASTSPDTAQVISQTQQTRGTETTGEAQPSTPAPSVPDPTAAATAATSSPTARGTTSGRAFPETATAAKTTDFPTTPSSSSHAAPPTAELLSSGTSPDATPAAVGMRSPAVPSTSPPTITGVPTDWTASSRTPREKPAVSQMAHTPSAGATRGPEVSTLAWQLTDTFSAVTTPPPSPTTTPTEHTSQTETRTPSPSGSSTASIPTPGSHSHGSQTTMPALSSGTAGGPSAVGPTTLRDAAPSSPSVVDSSEEVLTGPKSVVPESTTAVVTSPARPSASSTESTRAPPSSMGISSTHPRGPPAAVQTSATTSRTSPENMSPTSIFGSTLSLPFPPSTKTTLGSSSESKHPTTLQASTDSSSSSSTSLSNLGTTQAIPSFHASSSNSSLSQSVPGPPSTGSPPTLVPGHTAPLPVTTTSSPPTASLGSTTKTETSGMIPTSLWINGGRSTALSPPSTTSLTPTNSTPTTSTGFRSTTPSVPVQQGQGVSLFPYGSSVGDTPFVRRTVDFTSQLFKPRIGFPLGSFLRDSLYFTDNGQIIFPESDSQIFSYPNPPRRGFTAWDPVAVVAPFWDDADFSIRRGTIFYQEYETFYNEHNPLVWQVESWIRRFTNSWSYKAKWTLKVTWANAPAYPAQWTFGTCTYQAILSTDGSTSYALFLYQSNGMQWDVAQRPGNSVLMGFSSADGYFANSPLISRPVWERYRPDRWLNSKLGLRGLQIYRLHREAIPNYYLKCQQWLQSQPQWPSWNWNQISCPCTWQQGRWDLRFRPVGSGWWGHGGGRKLCRFSSWQGGVCCSYGPWGELREGWGVDSPWHFEQELEAQNWCCRWNDKPSFCSLYKRRRPPVSCAGYRPSRPGWMFGDPHITTLDGANFTFNGLGDFLLVRAWDGNSSFLLQGRTAQTGSAQATNFIAFAAQYESSSLAPITVQWFLEPNDTIRVLHNNQTVTFETDLEDAEGQEIFNTTGVLLTRNGSQVSASFDGTVAISVMAVSHLLHASSSLPEEYQGRTEGLLGLWNNNPDDDFRMPNGTSVARGSSEEQLFHYGMTWKLNGTGLLGQRDDQLPPTFTPVFFSQLLDNSSGDPALVSGCSGDRQCIYDALAMRDAGAGIHTRTLFRTYRQMNATQNQFPPSIKGEHVICAYKGKSVWIPYTSDSENVVFTLRNNCTDIKLFENGTLLWTPKSLEPFTLEILVRSTKTGLSSAFQPQTVLCACSAESQCLYNQTSWVGNSSLQVADCKCDGDTFGRFCERSKDPCEEECFPGVSCVPERGCEACPIDMTGDGRHCAALENSDLCQNHSCPVNYCHNQGHCYIAPTLSCQPSCTCPPAFTDARCFLAGNSFTPTTHQELPLRTIQLLLIEDENASVAEVNASVAYRLGTLDVRAFLWNSLVEPIASPAPGSGSLIQRWKVTSHFQYRPQGPVIDFLNNRLQEAVVQAFFLQAQRRRWKRSEGPRNNVLFYPISRVDVHDLAALNVSTLETYLKCNGYEGYHLVYGPQSGFTCTSPCTEGYCDHGGQCQHLPDGPRCSCVPFSIYSPWGERCEHLGVKVGAFLGILFGALGALLLLAIATFVLLRLCACGRVKSSYPLGLVG
nr:mucin-4 isoform X2 [Oryctolagus cuniculus]